MGALFTIIWPVQFTNMAYVLSILIDKSFYWQKIAKQSRSSYNSTGEGAIRTKSSAKASKKSCKDAIVYARLFYPCILRYV